MSAIGPSQINPPIAACSHARVAPAEPKGYYSRLFDKPSRALDDVDESGLIALGRAMRYSVEKEGTLTPRIGYTYFGQFIGHDLTHDSTPLAGPYLEPEETLNFRTPVFDLDHVYGGGPDKSPYLYDGESGAERFKIGSTTPAGYLRDLPVQHGRVLIGDFADSRNLDNLLLRQLHVIFLKFHNEAIAQLESNSELQKAASSGNGTSLFEQARRLVCWHYQWIIRHDYLPRILHATAWHYRESRTPRKPGSKFAIPIEFSLAAFRFGHSMVRNAYRLNCRKKRVVIEELMWFGQMAAPIPDDYLVEWGTFFDGLPTSGPQASSSFIDTSIAQAMHGLTPATIRLGSEKEAVNPADLPVRTLLRGARAELPSGQEVASALVARGAIERADELAAAQLSEDTCDSSGTALRRAGLENNTPLFYYILKEAELKGAGLILGPVGSYIVSEVIQSALETDADGYMANIGRDWELPSWRFPTGRTGRVDSLINIIRLIGDDRLLPECEAHRQKFLLRSLN